MAYKEKGGRSSTFWAGNPKAKGIDISDSGNRGPILGSFKFKENSSLFFFFPLALGPEMLYHSSFLLRSIFSICCKLLLD